MLLTKTVLLFFIYLFPRYHTEKYGFTFVLIFIYKLKSEWTFAKHLLPQFAQYCLLNTSFQ